MKSKDSYPIQYIEPILLKDGTLVQLRPIHPKDGGHAERFKGKLSEQSIYDRFLGYIPKVSKKIVDRMTDIDYSKEMAIVAEVSIDDEKEIIAVARIASEIKTETEFAVIIADNWQGKGLGNIMTDYMLKIAREMGFEKIVALVFKHNTDMLELLRVRGFSFQEEDALTQYAELDL